MPKFSKRSTIKLTTCHPDLQRLFYAVVKEFDCSVICGYRGQIAQERAFKAGKSKARFGQSKHNRRPSEAVDVVPYPINWNDRTRLAHFAGFVLGKASAMGIKVRWGGDWDKDGYTTDEAFLDMPHFELID